MRPSLRLIVMILGIHLGVLGTSGMVMAEPSFGFIGIQIQGVDKELAEILDLPDDRKILIRDVAADGPGAQAGLRRGDLILTVNGAPTTHPDLIKIMQASKPGDVLALKVRRNGKELDLKVTLAHWEEAWDVERGAFATLPTHGITLSALTHKLRERFLDKFALRWGTTGVLVTIVDAKIAGEDISLAPGDVIMQVNQQDVWLPKQFIDLIDAARSKGKKLVLLMVQRPSGYYYMRFPVR
ncbi:hypothetical protein JCM17960_32390 [Magnetospira thiophila]